jgi:hypothetical protein
LGGAEVVQGALMLPEDHAGTAQVAPQVDGLLMRLAVLRQILQRRHGLFVTPHGFAGRRALHSLRPGLPTVEEGFVPHLPAHGMLGQALDLIRQAVASERLQGLDDLRMQRPPPLLEQAAVGHLVRQRVLEGVFSLREEARLIEELGCLEVRQVTV